MADTHDLVQRVRASSSIPWVMPISHIDAVSYVDGTFGSSGGVPLDAAEEAGFGRFFVVLTQCWGYTKPLVARPRMMRAVMRRWPTVAEVMNTRPGCYNATLQRLYELEAQGRALLVFPEDIGLLVTSTRRDARQLRRSMFYGAAHGLRRWLEWRGILRGGLCRWHCCGATC